jgi:hypothetical protein
MSGTRLRIGRIIGFGLLAEVATAIIVSGATLLFTPSDSAAQRLSAVLGPGFGVLFTYIAATFAARPVPDRARQHGVLVGVVTSMLTIAGMISTGLAMLPIYLGAVLLKLAAGWAAGAQVEWKGREA